MNTTPTKIQSVQQRGNLKGLAKKIRCPQHHQKYLFKCQYPNCQLPFICPSIDCIQSHLHQGKIYMRKFCSEEVSSKFYQVDSLITDDTIYENARVLKNYIQNLKESIKNVYVGIKNINLNYDYLKGDLQGPLNEQYIIKVNQNYTLNQNVRKNLDELKQKVKIQFPIKDSYFSLRSYLIQFLGEFIHGFNWSKSQQLHSSKNDPITCEKFHQKLSGINNLLFIFIGDSKIVGSYYACEYPTLIQRSKKDPKSFMFVSQKDGDSHKFYRFIAQQEADQHITISEKNYICQGNKTANADGIRTFHKNFENIDFSLPSHSYKSTQKSDQTHNGNLKVRKFMILQAYKEKPHSKQVNHDGSQEAKSNQIRIED